MTVRHKIRPHGIVCDDRTEWLVVEESPSFYICHAETEGFCLKRKKDYELVPISYAAVDSYAEEALP